MLNVKGRRILRLKNFNRRIFREIDKINLLAKNKCSAAATKTRQKFTKSKKFEIRPFFSLYITMIQVCYLNIYIYSMSVYQL